MVSNLFDNTTNNENHMGKLLYHMSLRKTFCLCEKSDTYIYIYIEDIKFTVDDLNYFLIIWSVTYQNKIQSVYLLIINIFVDVLNVRETGAQNLLKIIDFKDIQSSNKDLSVQIQMQIILIIIDD